MLSELFQLDDSSEEEGSGESLRSGGSEDSYSEDEDEEVDEDEDSCSYSMSSEPSGDCKAVAIIKSVEDLSVPEKYKSTHIIRVCVLMHAKSNFMFLKIFSGLLW